MNPEDVPATRGDVARLDEKIEQLRSEMNHGYRDLSERITDSETRVLKAFYSYAESNQKRIDQNDSNDAATVRRVTALEGRMLEVEKRLNIPPAA